MELPQQLTLKDEGETLAIPCLEIVAISTAPPGEAAEGITHFYEACRRRLQESWRFVELANSTRARTVKSQDLDLVPFWMSDERSRNEAMIGLLLHSGSEKEHWGVPALTFHLEQVDPENPTALFRVCLPPDSFQRDRDAVFDFLTDALTGFPLAWGWVDFSLLWNNLLDDIDYPVHERLPGILKRFPGLSYGDHTLYQALAAEGVGHVGWITLLGPEYAERLGGLPALEERLKGSVVRLLKLADGAVGLQAGEEPSVGDVNRGDDLPLRREVGAILEPVRIRGEVVDEMVDIEEFDDEEATAWFLRFFSGGRDEDE